MAKFSSLYKIIKAAVRFFYPKMEVVGTENLPDEPAIRFCSSTPIKEERRRICDYLMEEISDIACGLPEHTVVPYRNIPKKYYPSNIPLEVSAHEKTSC